MCKEGIAPVLPILTVARPRNTGVVRRRDGFADLFPGFVLVPYFLNQLVLRVPVAEECLEDLCLRIVF